MMLFAIGVIDAGLAHRVLGTDGFAAVIQVLQGQMQGKLNRARLRWLALLGQANPPDQEVATLLEADVPAEIRSLAAQRLLKSSRHDAAVAALRAIIVAEPQQAPAAAQ